MRGDATVPGHRIARVVYREERIDCTCGAVVTAHRDTLKRDRHLPLVNAWARHRAEVGLTTKGARELEVYA